MKKLLLFLIGLNFITCTTVTEKTNEISKEAKEKISEVSKEAKKKVSEASKEAQEKVNEVLKLEPTVIQSDYKLPTSTRSFLAVSDIHLDIDAEGIHQTSWGWSDTDKQLWEYTKAKLSLLVRQKEELKIDFMVFTGDIPFHTADDDPKRAKNIGVVLSYLSALSKEANLPLLFAPGNNDGLAGDYASFRDAQDQSPFVKDSLNSTAWPFIGNNGICDGSGQGLCYIDGSNVYGYYSAYPTNNRNLRFIGLNTVINNNRHSNHSCYNPPADGERQAIAAAIQMEWFFVQMEEAAQANEKVMIAMHIPPGVNGYDGKDFWESFVLYSGETIGNAFIKSIIKHQDNVVSILAGHTHKDELKLILDEKDQLVDVCLFTPGITPQHGNNPGMKLYTYDESSYEIRDFVTYYGNFFAENKVQPFDNAYSFGDIYKKPSTLSIKEHLNNLWTKSGITSIQAGMAQTFNVGVPYTFKPSEKSAIEMRVNSQAIPVERSACVEK